MSLIPLLNEMLLDYNRPSAKLYDQNFGHGLLNDVELFPTGSFLPYPFRCGYLRPWRSVEASNSGVSSIHRDKNEFQIKLDVQQFKPEELKVSVLDGYVVVEGKHEERSDEHGFITRHFIRKYKLPDNANESAVASTISSDGVLTLNAPLKALPDAKVREISITQTN